MFSPEGELLAVCAYRGGGFHLWLLRPDGSGLRQLAGWAVGRPRPGLVAGRHPVTFASERGGDPVAGSPYRIWTVRVADGLLTQLTGADGREGPGREGDWGGFAPVWSPDGRFLALCDRNRINQRFREGCNPIRVADAESGAARLHPVAPHVSLSGRYDSGPAWSPDGRPMAVIVESALWLLPVRPDGTPGGEPRRLTDEAADHPSWSGDSRTLLCLSGDRLRLLDAGGGGTPRTVRVPLGHRRPPAASAVVHAGLFWGGTGEHVREDVDLLVRDGRVTVVEPHRAGRGARRRADASERTVIPGLWDPHIHPRQSIYGGRQTVTQLAYGITTAVSLGGFAQEQARLREAVNAGALAVRGC